MCHFEECVVFSKRLMILGYGSVWEDEQRGFGLGLNLKEFKIVNASQKRQGSRPFLKETSETQFPDHGKATV